jgi:hypothetical protein
MAQHVQGIMWRLAAKINVYQVVTLALALTAVIVPLGMPGGGGVTLGRMHKRTTMAR